MKKSLAILLTATVFALTTPDGAAGTVQTLGGNFTLDASFFTTTNANALAAGFGNVSAPAAGLFTDIRLQDDTSPSHYLSVTAAENLTANHTLSLVTGNTDRTLTFAGNATLVTGTMATTAQMDALVTYQALGSISTNQTVTLASGQKYKGVSFTTATPNNLHIVLSTTNAVAGATIDVFGDVTAATASALFVNNASTGGTQLSEFASDQTGTFFGRYVFNGTAWNRVQDFPLSTEIWTLLTSSTDGTFASSAMRMATDDPDYWNEGDTVDTALANIVSEVNNLGQAVGNLTDLPSTGILVVTDNPGSYPSIEARTLTNSSNITWTNGDGVSGNMTAELSNTGVSAATYGNATRWPAFTVDGKGRITGASNTSVGGTNAILYTTVAGNISSITTANNGVVTTNGTGVPSITAALPAAVQANITALGTVTSATYSANISSTATGATQTRGTGNATIATTRYVHDLIGAPGVFRMPIATTAIWTTNTTGNVAASINYNNARITNSSGNATVEERRGIYAFNINLIPGSSTGEAIPFGKRIAVTFRLYAETMTANTVIRAGVGKLPAGGIGSLSTRGFYLELTGTSLVLCAHNGTTLTTLGSPLTWNGVTADFKLESDGAGNVALYKDDWVTPAATITGGPTANATGQPALFWIEATNGVTSDNWAYRLSSDPITEIAP